MQKARQSGYSGLVSKMPKAVPNFVFHLVSVSLNPGTSTNTWLNLRRSRLFISFPHLTHTTDKNQPDSPPKASFFTFMKKTRYVSPEKEETQVGSSANVAQLQILQYVTDKREGREIFKDYKLVERLHCRFNILLCASAPVERLFSYTGMI